MAVSASLWRRATTTTRALARLAGGHRNRHYGFTTGVYRSSAAHRLSSFSSMVPTLRQSTAAKSLSSDESLVRVIESEIKCAEETDNYDRVEETPKVFPFKVEDNPGDQTIKLTREYEGECIRVDVHMPSLVTGRDDDDGMGEDDDPDRAEKPSHSSLPLVVSLSKKKGPCLEFQCTSFPDRIVINEMAVRHQECSSQEQVAYEGPAFRDLDDKLQKSFHKFLEMRGIKPDLMNFLHEYMINKDSREYFLWLKNLKKFVQA